MYFVIHVDDDGISVDSMEEAELIEKLDEQYYGEVEFLKKIDNEEEFRGLKSEALLIVKGEVIIPKPIKIVESYEV